MTHRLLRLVAVASLAACGSNSPAKSTEPRTDALAAETKAWEAAKPVFEKACASCHTSTGKNAGKKKLAHFNMDAYPLGGHHAATIGNEVREVLGLTGEKPTMPSDSPGSVTGDDLAKIKAWADAWDAADKAGAHPAPPAGAHDDDDDDDDEK